MHQPIFSEKFLKKKLDAVSINYFDDLDRRKAVLKEVINRIKTGRTEYTNEISQQADFLNAIFGEVLLYEYKDGNNWHLEKEKTSLTGGKSADGALGFFTLKDGGINYDVRVVIELKAASINLDKNQNRVGKNTPVEQAFSYVPKSGGNCRWVIVSNFKEIRLYNSSDESRYEKFEIQTLLDESNLKRFLFLLQRDRLMLLYEKSAIDTLYETRQAEEQKITKEFYEEYKKVRLQLFSHLKENNPTISENTLLNKAQKLIDRVIFICFCEDLTLLPDEIFRNIVKNSREIIDFSETKHWDRVKSLFKAIDQGYPDKNINKFNGGLFAEDSTLDNLIIRDKIILELVDLSEYDFGSDLNVNILGHIFEQSISDLEEIKSEIDGIIDIDKPGKRKKDGIFYTPEYITRYIVKECVGGWLEAKKEELGVNQLPELNEQDFNSIKLVKTRDKGSKKLTDKLDYNKNIEKHVKYWEKYREVLSKIKVLDPACGSGAFLNQVFDFLYLEGESVNSELAKLRLGQREAFDLDKHILTNNIYGVDLNQESVEITKLSLWLKTANKHKELTTLDDNIQCGNSIIDDSMVTGDLAFNWKDRFKKVFAGGGFDVIIGNPPYGAYLDQDSKVFLQKNYSTFQGNFEIYFFFIEKIKDLISKSGKLGFITPDTWINIPQAQKLRKHVLNEYGINTIVTFKHPVFADASVNAIVFILTHGLKSDICRVVNVESPSIEMFTGISKYNECEVSEWENSDDNQFQIWQKKSDVSLIKKIEAGSEKGETFLDVCQGIVPYSTEHLTKEQVKSRIYHSPTKIGSEYGIWIQGRAIKRYNIDLSDHEYLKYGTWLHRPRKPKYFSGDRILIQEITGGNPPRISAAICKETLYHDPGIISCLNISTSSSEYLLAVINSKLISWYNIKTSPKGKRTAFPKVLIGDIRKFPIKKVDSEMEKRIANLVIELTQLTIDFQACSAEFATLLKAKFKLEKLSTGLEYWHEINISDFLLELKKCKVKLSLEQESEWLKLFSSKLNEIRAIKVNISTLDETIDKTVFEIYGLGPDEIAIVTS